VTRRFALVLAVVLAAACTSTQATIDAGSSAFETHRARYVRVCKGGDATDAACVRYGTAINHLDDVLRDAEAGLDGQIPASAVKQVREATEALEKAAVP